MKYLSRNCTIALVLTTIVSGISLGAQANKRKTIVTKKIQANKAENDSKHDEASKKESPKKKYYFYDETTDTYIQKVVEQSQKLWRNGDPNEAVALLIKEQSRLDKKGRKVNLPGKFVKTSKGEIRRLRDGEKSELPLAEENEVSRLPSPLIMTLMTIRMDNGQCPLEMVDYYQRFSKNFRGNKDSIFAATQAVSLQGFKNKKSWEFVDATFDQSEKNLLIQQFIALSLSTTKVCISQNDLKIALEKISPALVPENIQQYYASLIKAQQDIIEPHFWGSCPQWTEYNVQNRLKRALHHRHERTYVDAYRLYETILARYSDQENIFTKVQAIYIEAKFEQALWHRDNKRYAQALEVYDTIREVCPEEKVLQNRTQYACLETRVEEVFRGNKAYQHFSNILKDYIGLLAQKSEYTQKANSVKALCGIFCDDEGTRKLIQEKALPSQLFAESRVVNLLSDGQRMEFDNFAWENCVNWEKYNFQRQSDYAIKCFQDGRYSDSLVFYDRLYKRYENKFTQETILSYVESAIRTEKVELVTSLLKKCEDIEKTETVIASNVLWLLRSGKVTTATSVIASLTAMRGEDKALGIKMRFYQAYSLLLNGKHEESRKVFIEMKKDHPKSLYTLKMSYLSQQRERLQSAFKFTRKDQFYGLINKAGKCFDEGELEMSLGIYLRIFAEYADRQEESSRACYLLGYYYLLSGDFEASNEILVFLQKQYKTTAYAKEADVLIRRIKDFTAS